MNSNSIPNAYCALLELLSIPGLVSEVRAELESVGYPTLQPSEYVTVIPSKAPPLAIPVLRVPPLSRRRHQHPRGARPPLTWSPTTAPGGSRKAAW